MNTPLPPKPNLFRRSLAKNFIDLRGLPVSLKILTVVGYIVILGLLFFTLLVELAGDRLPTVEFTPLDQNEKIPLVVMAIAGLAFIMGWAYLLTGAAAAKARIFLPILVLFAGQLFLVTGGNLLPLFLELLFFLTVLIIYGFTFRTRFWHDLPGLHFLGWLGSVSIIVILSVGISATNAQVAAALSANLGMVMLLTFVFWILLSFSIIDLGINIGRFFTRIARKILPFSTFSALIIFVLIIHPVVAFLVFWLTQDIYWVVDALYSILLILGALVVWLTRRWSGSTSAVFLTLSLAIPVVMLGISMASEGHDFTELLLNLTGIFPPTLLFVGLTTYNLLGMGVAFTAVDGRILPKRARVLLYFGTLLLVVACMLFFSNNRVVETNQFSMDLQNWINTPVYLSAFFLGIPYVIWLIRKRRDDLIGAETEFTQAPRWRWLERLPKWAWLTISILMAIGCSCLLAAVTLLLIYRST